jgi:PAS domain S-box-containing protein
MPGGSDKGEPIGLDARPRSEVARDLLIEAGAILASSLDPTTTMGQVARLTVPRLADLCVIDLRDEDGAIMDVAVVAAEEGLAHELEELRSRFPLDPAGEHPVAQVIRSGEPLLAEMTDTLLRSFAQGSEHARFMIEHGYRSAVVAPMLARGRTLGALSTLRLGKSERYDSADLDLACELALRAALAIDNAQLYSDLQRLEQRLEAVLVNIAEAITLVDSRGRTVFANQAAADLLGFPTPDALTRARPGTIMSRFIVEDEQGNELNLESMPARRLFRGEHPEPLLVRNIVRATGEERWLIVRSSPIPDPDTGRISYAVNVFENITEVKRAQLGEHFIAHTLQRALLPESLPDVPAAEIEARYCAAGELNEVGGDFYDVFEHGAESWMLVIGDVCGKGSRAAGVTALARHTLRAASMGGQSSAEMLGTLHRALRRQPPGADLCTACLVMVTPAAGRLRLTVTLAGHPPPVLIDARGEARQIGRPGTLLGVLDPIDVVEREEELQAGETLLLYTDGIPEAGHSGEALGERGLIELCRRAPELTLPGLLEHIEHAALEHAKGSLGDDLALLGMRYTLQPTAIA